MSDQKMEKEISTKYQIPGIKELAHEILELIIKKGPLCPSQISVELLYPIRDVFKVLRYLEEKGLVKTKKDKFDRNQIKREERPWDITKRRVAL